MYMITLNVVIIIWVNQTTSTLVGVSYLDNYNFDKTKKSKPGEDPCNPLYWYPRPIPEYCFISTPAPRTAAVVVPEPLPVPIPVQPIPFPVIPPIPPMPIMPPRLIPSVPLPQIPSRSIPSSLEPPVPLPFGASMIPVMHLPPIHPYLPSIQYPPYGGTSNLPTYPGRQQIGMVPGLPGLISPGGGINILPFSDAYADMFESYKQKMITKKLKKMYGNHNRYPWERWAKKRRKRLRG